MFKKVVLFFSLFSLKETFSSFLILFAVLDILGSIVIVINLRKKIGHIHAGKAAIAVGCIMIFFLFFGKYILDLFSVDISSFSVTGGIIILFLGLEMVLDIDIFKMNRTIEENSSSIIPLAFPIMAGAGTLTTILTLKAAYHDVNIVCGVLMNLILVYSIIAYSEKIEQFLGKAGISIVRKIMGIILLSIAIKLFKIHFFQYAS